jgi:hypothetical protein
MWCAHPPQGSGVFRSCRVDPVSDRDLGRVCNGWVRARQMIMEVFEVFMIGVWRARGGILACGCARCRVVRGRAGCDGRGVGAAGGANTGPWKQATTSGTSPSPKTTPPTAPATDRSTSPPSATPSSTPSATPATSTSPKADETTPPPPKPSTSTASSHDKTDNHGTRRNPGVAPRDQQCGPRRSWSRRGQRAACASSWPGAGSNRRPLAFQVKPAQRCTDLAYARLRRAKRPQADCLQPAR